MTAIPDARPRHDRIRPSSVNNPRWLKPIVLMSPLVLASCTVPQAATVAGDGDYRGTTTRTQVLRRTCPHPTPLLMLNVKAGVTYYPWDNQYIPVSILSNGTLSGSASGVQLTGTHDSATMQGDVTDGQCGMHFTVRKVGT
jgi:hypothetical protein